MIRTSFLAGRNASEREQRLVSLNTGGDNRSFIRKTADNIQGFIGKKADNALNPEDRRQRELLSDRSRLNAFLQPNIFVADKNAQSATGNVNLDALFKMDPARRLEVLRRFIDEAVPASVQERHADLFAAPLDEDDLEDYKQNNRSGRIGEILQVLSAMAGDTSNPIAKEALADKNNESEGPGRMYRLYEQWLDGNKQLARIDRTKPEILLASNSGIPDELRGIFKNNVLPEDQQSTLEKMNALYESKQTDQNLTRKEEELKYLELTGSVEKEKIRKETSDVMENWNNADPRLKLLVIGVGAAAIWQAFRAKNPLGRWALYGVSGYFAYDYFINGNQNAGRDMANGFKKVVQFGGGKVRDALETVGLVGPKRNFDKLQVMGDFLEKHQLPIQPAMRGMAALSTIKLRTIAGAFEPTQGASSVGGNLILESDETQQVKGPDGKMYDQKKDQGGENLRFALKRQMGLMNLSSDEKDKTFEYFQLNGQSLGTAVAHVFFLIAGQKDKEGKKQIMNSITSFASYDSMPPELKSKYNQMVTEGRKMALSTYGDQSLAEIIPMLDTDDKEPERTSDTAAIITDPKTIGRTSEFATMEEMKTREGDEARADVICAEGGLLDCDAKEFIENCAASNIIKSSDAVNAPSERCDIILKEKFDALRTSGKPLKEILDAMERLKYAILVSCTKQQTPLSRDQIVLMTGPDSLKDPASIVNRITGFLARFSVSLPGRGFGSVNSLADIDSLLTEPILGSGPLASNGTNFMELKTKLATYGTEIAELKDVKVAAKRVADKIPNETADFFGGKEKMIDFIATMTNKGDHSGRVGRAETQLSQRMANALTRSMLLNATGQGYGERQETLGITPTEQKNLAIEFDRLAYEILGDVSKGGDGMWSHVENIDVLNKFSVEDLEKFDCSTEPKRMEMVSYARSLSSVYLTQKLAGKDDAILKDAIGKRIEMIHEKLAAEKTKLFTEAKVESIAPSLSEDVKKEIQIKNLFKVMTIENQPSFTEDSFKDLVGMLKLLDMTVTTPTSFKTIYASDQFPPKYEAPGLGTPKFLTDFMSNFNFHPIEYWKNIFYGTTAPAGVAAPAATPGVVAPPSPRVAGSEAPAGSTAPGAPSGSAAPGSTSGAPPPSGAGSTPPGSPSGAPPPGGSTGVPAP